MNRLPQLVKLLELQPDDPMTKYMIALEYKKENDDKCREYFLDLKDNHPQYLPTYYIAGEYFYNINEHEISAEFLTKGLEIALEANNTKTYNEIKNLLFNVEMEM